MTLLSRACVNPYLYSIQTMYLVPFLKYSKNGVTLKTGLGVVQGENGAVRYIIYDFLLVGHCKYSSMLKIVIFSYPFAFDALVRGGGSPSEYCRIQLEGLLGP